MKDEPQGVLADPAAADPVPADVEKQIDRSRAERGLPPLGEVTEQELERAQAARDKFRSATKA